jgi:hypothetical protein
MLVDDVAGNIRLSLARGAEGTRGGRGGRGESGGAGEEGRRGAAYGGRGWAWQMLLGKSSTRILSPRFLDLNAIL